MAKSIAKILQQGLEASKLNLDRLQNQTDIPSHYLEMLFDGDWDKLPAKPYVRGYLIKLAEVLGLDEEQLLSLYSKALLSSSGRADALPSNRFSLPKLKYRYVVIAVIVMVILIYVVVFSVRSRTPYLELASIPFSQEALVVNSPSVLLEGRVEPGDSLLVNGEELAVNASGAFSHEYRLEPELNTLVFEVSRFLGEEIRVVRQVFFERITVFGSEYDDNATSSDENADPEDSREEDLEEGEL